MKKIIPCILLIIGGMNVMAQPDKLLKELTKYAPTDTSRLKLLSSLSVMYREVDVDTSLMYSLAEKNLAEEEGTAAQKMQAYKDVGMSYEYHSNFDSTLYFLNKALGIAEKTNNKMMAAACYHNMGMAYNKYGKLKEALEKYMIALRLVEQLGNKQRIAGSYNSIGVIYGHMGNNKAAEKYHQLAYTIQRELKDSDALASTIVSIAGIYYERNEFAKVIPYMFEAIKINTALNDKIGLIGNYANLGIVYFHLKQFDKAIYYYDKSKQVSKETNDKWKIMDILIGMSEVYMAQGKYDLALNNSLRALAIADTFNSIPQKINAYRTLAAVYRGMKNYRMADESTVKFSALKDSIFNLESAKQINEMREKYDTEIKDQQILAQHAQISFDKKVYVFLCASVVLLLIIASLIYYNQRRTKKLNTLVTKQKEELEQINKVKDKIFTVVGHDLRTPVNSVISFTQLLEHGNIPPEKLSAYAAELKNSLTHTSSLMVNLLNWARSQMQGYKPIMEEFDAFPVAEEIAAALKEEAAKKNITIRNNIATDAQVYADINMTKLLFRNILSNAIKFTRPDGLIILENEVKHNRMVLSITDSGVGIKSNIVNQFNATTMEDIYSIDSTAGTRNEKGTGLGLMLCRTFVHLMNGHISLKSEEGKGSTFSIALIRSA